MRSVAIAACLALIMSLAIPARATAATVSATWSVGVEPFGVTVDPRDGSVFVAISNSHQGMGAKV